MKKIIILLFLIILCFDLFSEIILDDYNKQLNIPAEIIIKKEQISEQKKDEKKLSIFSFKLGQIQGDLSIIGNWNIKLGYGAGFTLYPNLVWILTIPSMKEGIIFDQKRLFSLDWTTDTGFLLHLFFNDIVEQTEFLFRYDVNKIINSIYITNKFNGITVNPYRFLKGGKAGDINFGFDWRYKFYAGRFDIQFDSVQKKVDRFRGNTELIENKIFSSQYQRSQFFYLPDSNIVEEFIVYVNDENGQILIDNLKYKKLEEIKDYQLDAENGFIKFKTSMYNKNILIYYKCKINNNIYSVGDINCGKKAINQTKDFNKELFPEYFKKYQNNDLLILNFLDRFSYFEEKNSYKIGKEGQIIEYLNINIYNDINEKLIGYNYFYDTYTGCLRIRKSDIKGDIDNIYPFNQYVDIEKFYLTYITPKISFSKNIIEYSGNFKIDNFKLSSIPIENSIIVYLNSFELDKTDYFYDSTTKSIVIKSQINNSDIIEIEYLAGEEDAFNLSASLKNDFRINDYLMIGDSIWYKMPIKLWEDSYYFKLHSMEFLYNFYLKGDFHNFLIEKKGGKFENNINAGFSLFYPELKSLSIIEDFEYELKGYALNLDYRKWFAVSIPKLIYKDLNTTSYGKIFFRNMHKYGNITNNNFLSLDESTSVFEWKDQSYIGPYSSCDGYNNEKNSLSLILEYELNSNQAISVFIPISNKELNIDFTQFSQLSIAIKSIFNQGDTKLFIDAGEISEKFNEQDNEIQKESFDNGLKYQLIDENGNIFFLYKGKNDGLNITNDFNNNGILDYDSTNDITKFINLDNSSDFLEITNNLKKVVSFKIEKPEKLETIRGVRLTLYSKQGAKGKILINQLRFIETGWEFDKTKKSSAQEIFPAEDPVLEKNIFSQKNSTFDKKLHYQRYRERTLRINLNKDEDFSIKRKFYNLINIANFRKIGFFIFLKERSNRILKILLKDSEGNIIEENIDLQNIESDKWNQIELDLLKFSGPKTNNFISEITFDFINKYNDFNNNTIFLDEIYLNEPISYFGFGTKNFFNYNDPGINFIINKFVVFKNPNIKYNIFFNSPNFLEKEFIPDNNYKINNDITISFIFCELDFLINSTFDFILESNYFFNPNELLRFKISRNGSKNSPLSILFFYEYNKKNKTQINIKDLYFERIGQFELGNNFNNILWKIGYFINSKNNKSSVTQNRFYTEFKINVFDINSKFSYYIVNNVNNKNYTGNFSIDNFYYLFEEDFKYFFYDGYKKEQFFEINSNLNLLPDLSYTNFIKLNHIGILTDLKNIYNFKIYYENNNQLNFKVKILEIEGNLINLQIIRKIDNNYNKEKNILYWSNYFIEYINSFNYITPILFYPFFSSLFNYKLINFNQIEDTITLIIDWSFWINKSLFLPYKLNISYIELINNNLIYTPAYNLTFSINGSGEINPLQLRKINIEYTLTEKLTFKKDEIVSSTIFLFILSFYLINDIEIESNFIYTLDYNEILPKKEFQHKIDIKTKFYKNFFKKNYITNDKEGIETTILLDIISMFYSRIDKITESLDNPIGIYVTPKAGYRFNKNITLSASLKLGYTCDYSQMKNERIDKFGMEFLIEANLNF